MLAHHIVKQINNNKMKKEKVNTKKSTIKVSQVGSREITRKMKQLTKLVRELNGMSVVLKVEVITK